MAMDGTMEKLSPRDNARKTHAEFLDADVRLAEAQTALEAAEAAWDKADAAAKRAQKELVEDAIGGALLDYMGIPGMVAARNEAKAAGIEPTGDPATSWAEFAGKIWAS